MMRVGWGWVYSPQDEGGVYSPHDEGGVGVGLLSPR